MCILCKKTVIIQLLYLNKSSLKFTINIIVSVSIPKLDFYLFKASKKREGMNEYVEKEKEFEKKKIE